MDPSTHLAGDWHRAGAVSALVEDIRAALRASADPSRAPGQQAYMKSAMPFLGVTVPVVRRIARTPVKGPARSSRLCSGMPRKRCGMTHGTGRSATRRRRCWP